MKRFCTWLAAAALLTSGSARAVDEARYPRLHRAAEQLDSATDTLNAETRGDGDFGGHKSRAQQLIQQARQELEQAAQYADGQANGGWDQGGSYSNDSSAAAWSDNGSAPAYADEPTYDDPPADYVPPPPPVVYVQAAPPPSPVGFWGHHPIPGGGWCLAEGPHLHNYEPEFLDQFVLVDGYFKFGEGMHEWLYNGPHPIAGGGWCFIQGLHRHVYRPEVGFLYDPARHGYYYDRERAIVIRTELQRPPPHYQPPSIVVERYRHPEPIRVAPAGTPPPRPYEREHVLFQPHPAGRPPPEQLQHPGVNPHPGPGSAFHPEPGHEGNREPFRAQPGQAQPHPNQGETQFNRPPPPAIQQHEQEQRREPPPAHEPPPAAHPAPPAAHAPPPPAHAPPPAGTKAPPPKKDDKKKDEKK